MKSFISIVITLTFSMFLVLGTIAIVLGSLFLATPNDWYPIGFILLIPIWVAACIKAIEWSMGMEI